MPFDATPIKTNTVADVLRRARALIDSPEKWGRRGDGLGPERGRYCILLACGQVNGDWAPAYRLISNITAPAYPWEFNDAPATTHADVMAAFDRAIALAEQE
jgi:hypothetical protein